MFYTADRETGTFIDSFETVREARRAIRKDEEDDMREGTYEADFYDVVDENHCTVTGIWYAAMRDHEDDDWGTGSFDLEEAKRMCRNMGQDAYIAVIDDNDDPICIDEIEQADF